MRLGLAFVLPALLWAPGAFAGDSGLHVIDTVKIGGDGGWDYVTYDPISRKAFVAHDSHIVSVSLDTRAVNARLADVAGAHIALPLGDGKTLLVTQGAAGKASFIDEKTGADLSDVPTGSRPDGAIFDPATGKAFVLANGGHQINVIDPATHGAVGTIALDGAPESGAADGKGLLYTHLEDKKAIVVIDTRTLTVKATYPIDDCDHPTGLAVIDDQNLLLSACGGGIARISRTSDGSEVTTVAVGQRPDGALYDRTRKLGYVPSGDGKLTVISFAGKPAVVDVISTVASARTAALDPVTVHDFLPAADMAPMDPNAGPPPGGPQGPQPMGPPPADMGGGPPPGGDMGPPPGGAMGPPPGGFPQSLPNTFRLVVVGK